MDTLQDLRQRIDLRSLVPATEQRVRYRGYDCDLCVFHADTKPSLLIYPDGWKCLAGCGHGSAFDFVMRSEGLTFPQAIQRLNQIKGAVRLPEIHQRQPRRVDQRLGGQYHLALTRGVLDYYQEKLGFSTRTVVHFQLGYGVLPGKIKVGDDWVERSAGRFTIPIYVEDNLVNIKARRDDRCPDCWAWRTEVADDATITCRVCGVVSAHPDPEAAAKYLTLGGAETDYLYNADALYQWRRGEGLAPGLRTVVLTEGEYKAISLQQAGITAVSYGTATRFLDDWVQLFTEAEVNQVIHIADNDPAGLGSAELIRRKLKQFTRIIRLPNPPKGDVQEFLRDNDPAALWQEIDAQCRIRLNSPEYFFLRHQRLFAPRLSEAEHVPATEDAVYPPAA